MSTTKVTSNVIADDAVTQAKIADDAVGADQLASSAVVTASIVDLNVTTAKIAADAITGAKIADDTINSEHYASESIDTEHIADLNVTTAKIANDAITTAKIADDVELGGNPTTTTQSSGNNTTRIATTAFVTAAVAASSGSSAADDISTGDAAVTIGTSTGNITLDSPNKVILNADGGQVAFEDGSTEIGVFENSSSDFQIESKVQDKDIKFVGNDNGSAVTALTLDMSEAGHATFNAGGSFSNQLTLGGMIIQGTFTDGGGVGFNRNPASGAHIGDSGLRRFQINGPDSTFGDHLQIQSYNSSGTHQGNINIIDGKLGIGETSPARLLHVKSSDANVASFEGHQGEGVVISSGTDGRIDIIGYDDGASAYNNLAVRASSSDALNIDTGGRLTTPQQPKFGVARNAGYLSDDQVWVCDSVDTNIGSHYDSSNGKFTAPVAGTYFFTGSVMTHDSSSNVAQVSWSFRKNNSSVKDFIQHKINAVHCRVDGSIIMTLAANDFVTLFVNDSNTSSGWAGSQHVQNHFGGFLIG